MLFVIISPSQAISSAPKAVACAAKSSTITAER
jgi:hypothetical protein